MQTIGLFLVLAAVTSAQAGAQDAIDLHGLTREQVIRTLGPPKQIGDGTSLDRGALVYDVPTKEDLIIYFASNKDSVLFWSPGDTDLSVLLSRRGQSRVAAMPPADRPRSDSPRPPSGAIRYGIVALTLLLVVAIGGTFLARLQEHRRRGPH